MAGDVERLGVGYRRKFMGRDPWGQGVYAADDCAEYGVPHYQHVIDRRADRGWRLGPLLRYEARGGGPFREPVPDASKTAPAGEGISSVPGPGADEYHRR